MATFYTADLHFSHANIINYTNRPFDDVEQMNDALVHLWNDTVSSQDTVWVLGDVALGKLASSLLLVKRLNGCKLLVPGNHDRCWPGSRKFEKYIKVYEDSGFEAVITKPWPRVIGTRRVEVNHFPYRGDSRSTDRHGQWRPVDRGSWLLCGHVHERWRQNGRQINVGVDAWAGRPVSHDMLSSLVKEGPQELPVLDWSRSPV